MSQKDVPELFMSQITDQFIRDNFRKVKDFFRVVALFSNFKRFTFTFAAPMTHQKIPHGLGFLPTDILISSITGKGSVKFNQDLTDTKNFDVTVTGPCVVRLIAGAFD